MFNSVRCTGLRPPPRPRPAVILSSSSAQSSSDPLGLIKHSPIIPTTTATLGDTISGDTSTSTNTTGSIQSLRLTQGPTLRSIFCCSAEKLGAGRHQPQGVLCYISDEVLSSGSLERCIPILWRQTLNDYSVSVWPILSSSHLGLEWKSTVFGTTDPPTSATTSFSAVVLCVERPSGVVHSASTFEAVWYRQFNGPTDLTESLRTDFVEFITRKATTPSCTPIPLGYDVPRSSLQYSTNSNNTYPSNFYYAGSSTQIQHTPTFTYNPALTPRELVKAVGYIHQQMAAVVVRKQPGKCNLHVEDPPKVAEILLTKRWPPMQLMWKDYYKLESYLNRQSDNTRYRVVGAFHSPSRLLSQRQDALMVLLDLYSAKMLVKETCENVMPELRETRTLQGKVKGLQRDLFRERQRLDTIQKRSKRLQENRVMTLLTAAENASGEVQLQALREYAERVSQRIATLSTPTSSIRVCHECGIREVVAHHRCGHNFCGVCAGMMCVCVECEKELELIPSVDASSIVIQEGYGSAESV